MTLSYQIKGTLTNLLIPLLDIASEGLCPYKYLLSGVYRSFIPYKTKLETCYMFINWRMCKCENKKKITNDMQKSTDEF